MKRFLLLALFLAFSVFVACSDDDGPARPTATTASQVATPPPAETALVSSPEAPARATPTAPPAPQGPPSGTETGIDPVDAAISAVLAGDSAAFRRLIELRPVPCTNQPGLGGPPKCAQAPGGAAADGTEVEVLAFGGCEREWLTEEDLVARQDFLFSRTYELYAVLSLELDAPLFGEPYMPTPEYGVIFSYDLPQIADRAMMVTIQDDQIVYIDFLCDGEPSFYLTGHPQYADHHDVILTGPAYR